MSGKVAGERVILFETERGERHELANPPAQVPTAAVRIKARGVVPSPYMAHVDGRYLWVIEVEPSR